MANPKTLPQIRYTFLKDFDIFQQLQLEEALTRAGEDNHCLISWGKLPTVVMGISGKVEELLAKEKIQKDSIPVLKRFSGGGTVITDENTLFFTIIINKEHLPVAPFPEPIMRWTAEVLNPAFSEKGFSLRENDYVFGELKIGGNAQYIRKNRCLHHTSFLWDYQPERMEYLLHPPKAPDYRQGRSHKEFLGRIRSVYEKKGDFRKALERGLRQHFEVQETALEDLLPILQAPHRKSTHSVAL